MLKQQRIAMEARCHKGQQRSIRRVIFGDSSEEPLDFLEKPHPEGNLYTDASQRN